MERAQAEQVAASQLDAGERLLWTGFPNPAAAALRALPVTFFGIPFTAFACFWIWQSWAMTSHVPKAPGPFVLFPLFGIPFLLVGLGVLGTPLWVLLGAQTTIYAITDKRALIITGSPSHNIQSFTPADMGDITRLERPDGSGSVYFASRSVAASSNGVVRMARIGFEGIPDVKQVEQLLRDQIGKKAA